MDCPKNGTAALKGLSISLDEFSRGRVQIYRGNPCSKVWWRDVCVCFLVGEKTAHGGKKAVAEGAATRQKGTVYFQGGHLFWLGSIFADLLLRGAIVHRTCGIHKNLSI